MTTLTFPTITLNAALPQECNPLPDLNNVSYIHASIETTPRVSEEEKRYFGVGMVPTLIPYLSQDKYDRNRRPTEFHAAVLENEYLKATFLPELGGRLWSLYHKPSGKELLYRNEIVQPCNLALRNAWMAGGIEWNAGIKGHTPFTCSPLYAAESRNRRGEPILTMYEYERIRGVVFGMNFLLDEDRLYVRTTLENRADSPTYAYWWSNIAVPETGTRVLTDADEMITCFYGSNHYVADKAKTPFCGGEDVSYPQRSKNAGDLFFCLPAEGRKWIAAVQEDGTGLLQYATPELRGRKVFYWGQGQGGRNWNRFLTESDRPYIEMQAGLARTQLEHLPLPARTVWSWTECYTPLSADPQSLYGDWDAARRTVRKIVQDQPDPAQVDIPLSAERVIRQNGSGWGALEHRAVSDYYSFTADADDGEVKEWIDFDKNGFLAEPAPETPPKSYRIGAPILAALERSAETEQGNHWYTWLQIGVTRYAAGDPQGAQEAWEKSLQKKENAWAYRNLAMLSLTVFGTPGTAVEQIERAAALICGNLFLRRDEARILTDCGKWKEWEAAYDALPASLAADGRLRLYTALARLRSGNAEGAKAILNETFTMSDIKEGELSVTALWNELYGSERPIPARLDFRMHE